MENSQRNVMSAYDFLEEGKSLYDIIEKYIPLLNGDFSTENLITTLRDAGGEGSQARKWYNTEFNGISNKLLSAVQSSDRLDSAVQRKLSPEEEEKLLQRFNSIDVKSLRTRNLKTVDEYITCAKANIDDPEYQELRDIIVEQVFAILKSDNLYSFRAALLKIVYAQQAINLAHENNNEDDVKILRFFQQHLDKDELLEYDTVLTGYRADIAEYRKSRASYYSNTAKRADFVKGKLKEGLFPEQIGDFKEFGLEYAMLGDYKEEKLHQGDYVWKISRFDKPIVVLDEKTNYSQGGQENQRVIAVSYGKFEYGTMFNGETPTITGNIAELVGITRIGTRRDDVHNYFVLVPFDTFAIRDNDILKRGERRKSLREFGLSLDEEEIRDFQTKKRMYLVETSRIPEELKEFFTNVVFSDYYLGIITNQNYRYVGTASQYEDGIPRINASLLPKTPDLLAMQYASQFDGTVEKYASARHQFIKKTPVASIGEFIKSGAFLDEHIRFIQSIVNKQEVAKGMTMDENSSPNFDSEGDEPGAR